MSERYSLRATPKKTDHPGFVETPRPRKPRRKSQFPEVDGDDSSSATESASAINVRAKTYTESAAVNGPATGNGLPPVSNGFAKTSSVAAQTSHGVAHTESDQPKALENDIRPSGDMREGRDPKIDHSGQFEFGGSAGVTAMMLGFPILMYYMWIGATYYDGKAPIPAPDQTFLDFARHMGKFIYEGAFPSLRAWKIYWVFLIFETACYCLLPGIYAYGKPLPHEGGKQLKYYCSAVWSFYTTIVIAAVLHFTNAFPLYTILDEFGPIMSVAIISGYLVSIIAYISALARGAEHRMTGHFLYDFFMGAELNPRMFGVLDFKMFFEVRLPWYFLLALSCAAAARQYENYGYVSGEVAFLVMAHFLYANACSKGEELIVTTWDMYFEKWGFMLIFWNMAGVPLSYCHCTLFVANHPPSSYHWNPYALGALYVSYLFMYWVWDSTNSQKNRFRNQERGNLIVRKTFPQLPWQTVHNPRIIKTQTGDSILADGWYGIARKIHYTCDLFFALCWGLVTGFSSPFPWFYPLFFAAMISHRAHRDIQKCKEKYGPAWDEYTKLVPYLFIPYVF